MNLGLIGYPLSHSFSKTYFEEKFRLAGLSSFQYHNIEIASVDQLEVSIRGLHLDGFNVTIPHKETILPLLQRLEGAAGAIAAVNCVKVNWADDAYTLTGHNTDHYGFGQSIKPFLEPIHNRALILGTGGSSKAVAYALQQVGVEVFRVTRGEKQQSNSFLYDELNAYVLDAFKLIVNTTPLGMHPHTDQCPAIPYQYLTPQHVCYDLIYNPEETLFLKTAKAYGAVTLNGLNMLRLQADKSWEIWQA